MKKAFLLVLVLMALALVGCDYDDYRVETAFLRDTLFSVEETEKGNWRIWMTHDDIAGYCTMDAELGKQALSLLLEHPGEVVVEFRDIKHESDPEYNAWHTSECGNLYSNGAYVKMFLFTDVYAVGSR